MVTVRDLEQGKRDDNELQRGIDRSRLLEAGVTKSETESESQLQTLQIAASDRKRPAVT
jgi:hypothetical protein